MLISEKKKIGFIHIPKCGGSTIKHQFAALADTDIKFSGVHDHPILGKVFLGHLPLWAIRAHYPEIFQKLEQFRLFAICRDPHERFESAISQHLKFHHGKRINDYAYCEVLEIAGEIIDHLCSQDRLVSAGYCHFIRQSDFIFLDGKRIVGSLYPLSQLDRLAQELGAISGLRASAGFKANQTLDFRLKGSEAVVRWLSGYSRKLLPVSQQAAVKSLAKNLLTKGPSRIGGFSRREKFLLDFINSYYAKDIELYREVSAVITNQEQRV